jgi:hypothetical protein
MLCLSIFFQIGQVGFVLNNIYIVLVLLDENIYQVFRMKNSNGCKTTDLLSLLFFFVEMLHAMT